MYSQYGEDDYVMEIVKECASAKLLEIGAWNPVDKSNSRALIERGWSAVLIEPSPGPMLNLLNEYAGNDRVHLIQAAVGVEGGLLDLMVTDDAVSTADRQQYEAWKKVTSFRGALTVPCISVIELFARLGGAFEFVSIDTEGTSVDIFAEMVRIGPRPLAVVVEHDSRIVELNQFAEKANYRQVHINGTNVVFEWTGKRE